MTTRAQRVAAVVAGGLALAGCAEPAADVNVGDAGFREGTFTGRSAADDQGTVGEVSITIAGDAITEAAFSILDADGSVKGEDYGKTNGEIVDEETYRLAQQGIAAADDYAAKLVETDDLGGVDAISGATLTHRQFVGAVEDALAQARV